MIMISVMGGSHPQSSHPQLEIVEIHRGNYQWRIIKLLQIELLPSGAPRYCHAARGDNVGSIDNALGRGLVLDCSSSKGVFVTSNANDEREARAMHKSYGNSMGLT
jgi:hypothetical protein